MALSTAERQRKWHEKQKEENKESYLEKERKRRKDRYVPSSELLKKELEKRRAALNKAQRKHYQRKKKSVEEALQNDNAPSSSRITRRKRQAVRNSPLIVKMPLPNRSNGVRKRHSTVLRKAYRELKSLRSQSELLTKSNRRLQKRIERIRKKNESKTQETGKDSHIAIGNLTPRKKTFLEMRRAGLVGKRFLEIKRKIMMANSLIAEIKTKKKDNMLRKLSCELIKRYRCVSLFSEEIRVSRKRVVQARHETKARRTIRNQIQNEVLNVLEREDNSTTLPWKKDFKTSDGEIKQKRILTDYLHNLHEKFLLENPALKVSQSVFYKMKPEHILYANFSSRKTCLCTKHQNVALKIRCLRKYGIQAPTNPDVFIKEFKDNQTVLEAIEEICPHEIKFFHWLGKSSGQ